MQLKWQPGWINKDNLETEIKQCTEEGKDISSLRADFDELIASDINNAEQQTKAEKLLDAAQALPQVSGYKYMEPSDLESIRTARPKAIELSKFNISDDELYNKVYGAWLGRCAGCMAGKPVEGIKSPVIKKYLESQNRWPLDDYFSRKTDENTTTGNELRECDGLYVENMNGALEDDDTNYTTTGLAIIKNHGYDFTPVDVVQFWLYSIPIYHTFTAEQVAYRNFINTVGPPESASFRNPYREWIGAQIRADFFGYVCPGDTARAAEYAWRDACISHVKNGIYGEMWVAARLASAYQSDDIETVIRAGLAQIPSKSRLTEAIENIISKFNSGISYEDIVLNLHSRWNENDSHDWCHTISNAEIVAIALLWGEKDFTKTIGYSIMPGFDTDCNGATAGSVLGLIIGADAIPSKWTKPLNDKLETGVAGYYNVKISDMAKETIRLQKI